MDLLQKAVDLVHGPYLANIDADWVMPERVRLQEAYQAVLLRLGELYLELGQAEFEPGGQPAGFAIRPPP